MQHISLRLFQFRITPVCLPANLGGAPVEFPAAFGPLPGLTAFCANFAQKFPNGWVKLIFLFLIIHGC
jgi:hypothetical protein